MPPENTAPPDTSSFGMAIASSRKRLGMSQKDLAAKILKEEDDKAITPQYLNDIEHDRRSPSSEHMVKQFASVLKVSKDVLFFLAQRVPSDLTRASPSAAQIDRGFRAFRKVIKE